MHPPRSSPSSNETGGASFTPASRRSAAQLPLLRDKTGPDPPFKLGQSMTRVVTMRWSARPRLSVVVAAGNSDASERGAAALIDSLAKDGVEVLYLSHEASAGRIAAAAKEADADAVEICVAGFGVVTLLRDLLRELKRLDRPQIDLVVHKVK